MNFARIATVTALLACAAAPIAAQHIAQVGTTQITPADIELRRKIETAYSRGKPPTTTAALVLLVNDALLHEVARRHGALPSEADINSLAEHADATTRDPELLERVKRAFDGDLPAYRRLYLAPRATENLLREWHSRNEALLPQETTTTAPATSTYSNWLRRASAETPITIRADFLADLRRLHPGVWWLGHVTAAP